MARPPAGTRVARFFDLSVALTGDDDLPRALSKPYLERFDRAHPGELDPLLEAFVEGSAGEAVPAQVIARKVTQNAQLWSVAGEVIGLWLLSRLVAFDMEQTRAGKPTEEVPPEQYYQSRIWDTARAHPPGLSGGYFGYWHYAPEA